MHNKSYINEKQAFSSGKESKQIKLVFLFYKEGKSPEQHFDVINFIFTITYFTFFLAHILPLKFGFAQ